MYSPDGFPLCLRIWRKEDHVFTAKPERVIKRLDKGADIHEKNAWMLQASCQDEIRSLIILLDRGADVHANNDEALREAAAYGRIESLRILLRYGANVHACDDKALKEAADQAIRHPSLRDYRQVIAALLRHGADPTKLPTKYVLTDDDRHAISLYTNWQRRKSIVLWMKVTRIIVGTTQRIKRLRSDS